LRLSGCGRCGDAARRIGTGIGIGIGIGTRRGRCFYRRRLVEKIVRRGLRFVWRVFGLFRTLESFEKAEHDLAW